MQGGHFPSRPFPPGRRRQAPGLVRLQLARPEVRAALENRGIHAPVLRLDPLPETSLAEFPAQPVLSAEPLLSTSDPVRVNFVEQSVVPGNDPVLPHIPEAREIVT